MANGAWVDANGLMRCVGVKNFDANQNPGQKQTVKSRDRWVRNTKSLLERD